MLDPASEPVAETDGEVLDGVLTTVGPSAGPGPVPRRVVAVPDLARRHRTGEQITLTAVPYFSWGNRGPGAMRIFVAL